LKRRNPHARPGVLSLHAVLVIAFWAGLWLVWPRNVQSELRRMGYTLTFSDRTSGPINAIFFDWRNGAFWGGSSNHGDDYGVVWE